MKSRKWRLVNDSVSVEQGDDAVLAFNVALDTNGTAVDVSAGHTAIFAVRASDTSIVDVLNITEANMTLNADGSIAVPLTSAATAAIAPGNYVYELELKQTVPAYVETISSGIFKVTRSIAGVGAPV